MSVQHCSPLEQTADEDEDDVTGDCDKDAVAVVDEPSSHPAPEIASRDDLPDVTVVRDNAADATAVPIKPFGAQAASDMSLVSFASLCDLCPNLS